MTAVAGCRLVEMSWRKTICAPAKPFGAILAPRPHDYALEPPMDACALRLSLIAVAQQTITHSTPDASHGRPASAATVTGHVYLSDTKGHARRATVYLHAVASLEADAPPRRGSHGYSSSSANHEIENIGAQTRLDGSFSFSGVKAVAS